MNSLRNLPYYLTAVGFFILLKFGFTRAENTDLIFLLKPTAHLTGLVTGSESVFISEYGYFFAKLNIYIDKSCAGMNFWALSFLLFSYLLVKNLEKPRHKVLALPLLLIFSYLVTIFVNTSRIIASVTVQHHADAFLTNRPHHLLHEAIGIIVNVSFLVLFYYLSERFILKKRNHEKPA